MESERDYNMAEMVIGLPIKVGEDIFIRDDEGNIVGQKNTPVEVREEHVEELRRRKVAHEERLKKLYSENRKVEYPDFGEFADMMYHRIDAIIEKGLQGELTTVETEWYAKCKAIKEKYPKPA